MLPRGTPCWQPRAVGELAAGRPPRARADDASELRPVAVWRSPLDAQGYVQMVQ